VGNRATSTLSVASSQTNIFTLGGVVAPSGGTTVVIKGTNFAPTDGQPIALAVTNPASAAVTGFTIAQTDSGTTLTITKSSGTMADVMTVGMTEFAVTINTVQIKLRVTTVAYSEWPGRVGRLCCCACCSWAWRPEQHAALGAAQGWLGCRPA
jgi:hypothetical protein